MPALWITFRWIFGLIRAGAALLDYDHMSAVPFFANTDDDTHCVQAAFRIMLKYFLPGRDFSYQQLDEMSMKQPGKGTWWPPMLLELQKLGLLIKDIEAFDYKAFHEEGEGYVKRHFPPAVAAYHLERTNLMDIKSLIPEFVQKIDLETRPATIADVRALLERGCLVGLGLNSRTLNDKPGYSGHMVVVYENDATGQKFWLHDPGLPARPSRRISRRKLEQAWFWAGQDNAELVAVKLNIDS